MAKHPTHPIKTEVVRELMNDKGISVGDLVAATKLTRKAINSILSGESNPREDNLVLIAVALGVRWRTLLVGYDGEPQEGGGSGKGGVIVEEKLVLTFDLRAGMANMTNEEVMEVIFKRLGPRIGAVDEVKITFIRDSHES